MLAYGPKYYREENQPRLHPASTPHSPISKSPSLSQPVPSLLYASPLAVEQPLGRPSEKPAESAQRQQVARHQESLDDDGVGSEVVGYHSFHERECQV